MLNLAIIIILALVLLAQVAAPLLLRDMSDPLPDLRDPLLLELEEEGEALLRAIRELDAREDLPEARQVQLRERYEAKAARVLAAADARRTELKDKPVRTAAPGRSRRMPLTALSLLAIFSLAAVVMSGHVLPRVGPDATLTTGDLEAGRELRNLKRAADRNPSQANLLPLADAYWRFGDLDGAAQTYLRLTQSEGTPAIAYRRLGFMALHDDLQQARDYLEQARIIDPEDSDTLFALSELYFAQDQPERAAETLAAYLASPAGAGDTEAQERLDAVETAMLLKLALEDPSEASLLALADAYWQIDEHERAAGYYMQVLTDFNEASDVAYSRLGQLLFMAGHTGESIELLERASELNGEELATLLFLGNGYFTVERYQDAIDTWQLYVNAAGGEEQAGRVPGLISTAQARRDGTETDSITGMSPDTGAAASTEMNAVQAAVPPVAASPSGTQLFAANCARCHGAQGNGGSGPRLAGSGRARNETSVRDAIRHGRGMMPGFRSHLADDEIEQLTRYVVGTLGPS